MTTKTLLKTLGALLLGLGLSLSVGPEWSAQAAITLPDTWRPSSLPDWQFVTESSDPNHPEKAATDTVILFVGDIASQIMVFLASAAIVFIIISGARYIFAWGKEDAMDKGKRGIFWSVIGLLMVMFSYALIQGIIQIILQIDSSTD